MWEIARVINCHDASLEEVLTALYLPAGFLKVTNVYIVLLILMSKGYCIAFVVFPSLKIVCPYTDSIPLFYGISIREIEINTNRLYCDKNAELR